MLDVCCDPTLCDEYIAIVKAGNECQLTVYMSLHGKFCYGCLLRGSVVPAKFLLVSLNTLPAQHETPNVLVVVWSGEQSALRITERDTAQTERILMRLVDTSSLDSRLHQSSKRVFARHPCSMEITSKRVSRKLFSLCDGDELNDPTVFEISCGTVSFGLL